MEERTNGEQRRTLIACSGVDFGYENYDVVVGVTMTVREGDYFCIVGENGSGKSTLMKGLLGLLKPTGGSIEVEESLRRTGIGYLPQQTAAQRDFPATVREVVLSGCLSRRGMRPFYSRKEAAVAEENMERVGITPLKDHCYRELSGGQQQRVLIARALCATSRLLILDEPVTGLDPSAIQDFYGMLKQLNRSGVAILMVSHDIRNVVSQADKILHLKREVLFCGTVKDYRNSPVGKTFLGGEE